MKVGGDTLIEVVVKGAHGRLSAWVKDTDMPVFMQHFLSDNFDEAKKYVRMFTTPCNDEEE